MGAAVVLLTDAAVAFVVVVAAAAAAVRKSSTTKRHDTDDVRGVLMCMCGGVWCCRVVSVTLCARNSKKLIKIAVACAFGGHVGLCRVGGFVCVVWESEGQCVCVCELKWWSLVIAIVLLHFQFL